MEVRAVLLEEILERLYELKGYIIWKKYEPRPGYAEDYYALIRLIERVIAVLRRKGS